MCSPIRLLSWIMATGFVLLAQGCAPVIIGEMEALEEEGRYAVTGPWGFAATLAYEETNEWSLDGGFAFPSSGYTLLGANALVAESYPEQVTVSFLVMVPAPHQVVLPMIVEEPVNLTMAVSQDATFEFRFVSQWRLARSD